MPVSMSTVSTSTSPHGHSTKFSFSSILISQLTGQKLSEVTTLWFRKGLRDKAVRMSE